MKLTTNEGPPSINMAKGPSYSVTPLLTIKFWHCWRVIVTFSHLRERYCLLLVIIPVIIIN